MEVINERCCGLDVHKKRVVPCVITPQGQETRTFSTLTQGLLELADWLVECQVPMSPWRVVGSSGSRFTICWRGWT
jgi:hypothetical protein